MSSCCPTNESQPSKTKKIDWVFIGPLVIISLAILLAWLQPNWVQHTPPVHRFIHGITEFANAMWFSIVLAIIAMGLLNFIPKHWFQKIIGNGGTISGIARAMVAGVLLDLCSHGILMVGAKLYKEGASFGQLIAFLVTSPWNSFSMMLLLAALVGWQWVGIFLVASAVVGFLAGILADLFLSKPLQPLSDRSTLTTTSCCDSETISEQSKIDDNNPYPTGWLETFISGVQESSMVLRWVLLGLVMAATVRALFNDATFATTFSPTLSGLGLTLLATSVIEVCSEGSIPIAADLLTRAHAPGNAFAFLMAGVATDITEMLVIKDITSSWKLAILLPLLTVPWVLLIGWWLNSWAL